MDCNSEDFDVKILPVNGWLLSQASCRQSSWYDLLEKHSFEFFPKQTFVVIHGCKQFINKQINI